MIRIEYITKKLCLLHFYKEEKQSNFCRHKKIILKLNYEGIFIGQTKWYYKCNKTILYKRFTSANSE